MQPVAMMAAPLNARFNPNPLCHVGASDESNMKGEVRLNRLLVVRPNRREATYAAQLARLFKNPKCTAR